MQPRIREVRSNKELISVLEELVEDTDNYLNTPAATIDRLTYTVITLKSSLQFTKVVCDKLTELFRYFRGEFDGGDNTITICSDHPVVLFSSIYNSAIHNLKIHNVVGSRGLLLADDINNSTIKAVTLTGNIVIDSSIGGLARTITGGQVVDCSVNITTRWDDLDESGNKRDPASFGGLVCHAYNGVEFKECEISGTVNGDLTVGGICATAKDITVTSCNAVNLTISGNRELGLLLGSASGTVSVANCLLLSSTIIGSIYLGSVCGLSQGSLAISDLYGDEIIVTARSTAFFVGGLVGKASILSIDNATLSLNVSANFIVAAICPDVSQLTMHTVVIGGTLVCSGYSPMMHHVYELTRSIGLTSDGLEIEVNFEDVTSNIVIKEAENEGTLDPFKAGIV